MSDPIEYLDDPGVPYHQTEESIEARKFYNGPRWRKTRAYYLKAISPLCEQCKLSGIIRPATRVHHIIERHLCTARMECLTLITSITSKRFA